MCYEKHEMLVRGQSEMFAGFGLVAWLVEMRVNGIWYAFNTATIQQWCAPCNVGQPMAARYKADAPFAIGFTLAAERACGEVAVGWPCQLWAVAAGGKPTLAVLGVVTDACAGRQVLTSLSGRRAVVQRVALGGQMAHWGQRSQALAPQGQDLLQH